MIELVLNVLLVLTSSLLIVLILLHRGKGGGLSSMFGGGVSSSLSGSSVVGIVSGGRGSSGGPGFRYTRGSHAGAKSAVATMGAASKALLLRRRLAIGRRILPHGRRG